MSPLLGQLSPITPLTRGGNRALENQTQRQSLQKYSYSSNASLLLRKACCHVFSNGSGCRVPKALQSCSCQAFTDSRPDLQRVPRREERLQQCQRGEMTCTRTPAGTGRCATAPGTVCSGIMSRGPPGVLQTWRHKAKAPRTGLNEATEPAQPPPLKINLAENLDVENTLY